MELESVADTQADNTTVNGDKDDDKEDLSPDKKSNSTNTN